MTYGKARKIPTRIRRDELAYFKDREPPVSRHSTTMKQQQTDDGKFQAGQTPLNCCCSQKGRIAIISGGEDGISRSYFFAMWWCWQLGVTSWQDPCEDHGGQISTDLAGHIPEISVACNHVFPLAPEVAYPTAIRARAWLTSAA